MYPHGALQMRIEMGRYTDYTEQPERILIDELTT